MRIFQTNRCYPALRSRLREIDRDRPTFRGMIDAFLDFRECAAHILEPVYAREEWAFFTNHDDELVQRRWAKEQGLSSRISLSAILKAQIEAHRTEIIYTLDATSLERDFIKTLPGCVRKTIAWHASPFKNVVFSDCDLVVCNFPSILAMLKEQGCRTEYFAPAHDPELAPFAARQDRPIDVLFVGSYSRHHERRAKLLEAVAALSDKYNVVYHLDRSRLCRLAESPIGQFLPLAQHRRPKSVTAIARPPAFGLDLYGLMSKAKIMLNGAIDMAGPDRGNMRCFEAMGSGALLLSDDGVYPDGMRDGETLVAYKSQDEAVERISYLLKASEFRLTLARAGYEMTSARYSKKAQWTHFQQLVAAI
jgi:glycosyltransferase involved in cell wall biosynthesis